jgi:hypothetical protein
LPYTNLRVYLCAISQVSTAYLLCNCNCLVLHTLECLLVCCITAAHGKEVASSTQRHRLVVYQLAERAFPATVNAPAIEHDPHNRRVRAAVVGVVVAEHVRVVVVGVCVSPAGVEQVDASHFIQNTLSGRELLRCEVAGSVQLQCAGSQISATFAGPFITSLQQAFYLLFL